MSILHAYLRNQASARRLILRGLELRRRKYTPRKAYCRLFENMQYR